MANGRRRAANGTERPAQTSQKNLYTHILTNACTQPYSATRSLAVRLVNNSPHILGTTVLGQFFSSRGNCPDKFSKVISTLEIIWNVIRNVHTKTGNRLDNILCPKTSKILASLTFCLICFTVSVQMTVARAALPKTLPFVSKTFMALEPVWPNRIQVGSICIHYWSLQLSSSVC